MTNHRKHASLVNRRTFLAAAGLAAAGAVAVPFAVSAASAKPLSQTAVWGAYADSEPYPNCAAHYALEDVVQSPLNCMSWFVNWSAEFPAAAQDAKAKGYELLIAWMPVWNGGAPVVFSDIVAGKYDSYIKRFFTACQDYGHPVTIRFAHEVNLGKHPWSVGQGGSTSIANFVAGWRHIYALMQQYGGPKTQLLYSVSTSDGVYTAEQYFPGLAYLDKVGFGAFSGFTSAGWTEPAKLLTPMYTRLVALAPDRPLWVTEVACREATSAADVAAGRSKAKWTADLFAITTLPEVSHVLFFNDVKEQDWRLNSSASALAAAKKGLQSRPNL